MKINCKIYICITHECKEILEEREEINHDKKNYGILVINSLVLDRSG